jgi:multidrug efflux pump subunit AcrB
MRKLIAFFIQNPIWGNAIIFLTAIFGILSLLTMRSSFFPEMEPKTIYVNVVYPGASPLEVEEGITTKIEQALEGIKGVKEITSTSNENLANIRVEGLEDADMDDLLSDVENAVNSISSFPAGAEKPVITKVKTSGMSGTAAFVSLLGPNDIMKLKTIADEIKDDLLNTKAISQIEVFGYPALEFSIEVSEENLLRYNLRFDQVVNAIRTGNIDLTGGTIKTSEEEYIIRLRSKKNTAQEIKNIVLRAAPGGDIITIGQVAEVKFQFSETPNYSFLNNKRNITFFIKKLPEEDLSSIANEVRKYVNEFNRKNKEYELKILFQFEDMLQERIDLLVSNGWIGLILVLVCLGFFLSLRLSTWVAFGIPFSFLGMFAFGALYGITINMISLFGMILVVGILVDDGIVIAENVYTHFQKGKSPIRAAYDGTVEVMSSIITSVLTTVVAFVLLMFAGGELKMMREMAFSVSACLLFSMVEAFLVLPSHLAHSYVLKPVKINWYQKFRNFTDKVLTYLRDAYASVLKTSVKYYRFSVFIPLLFIIFIIGLIATGLIKLTFFPNIPFEDIKIEVAFKPGEREEKTEAFLRYCQEKVYEVNQELINETGDTLIQYTTISVGNTESLRENGGHAGLVRININANNKKVSSNEIANRIRKKIGEVKDAEKFVVGGEVRFGKPISIAIADKDYNTVKKAKEYLKGELKKMPELKDVTDDSPLGKQEIIVHLKPKAYMLGLTQGEVMRQIRQGFFGEEAQRIIIGKDEVKIWVRYPKQDRSSLGQFENMRIKTLTGENFPLGEIADYKIERGEVGINHYNGKKEIKVEADQTNMDAPTIEITNKIKDNIITKLKEKFPTVEIKFRGQAQRAEESAGPLIIVVLLVLLFIPLVLALNFGSLMQSIIIVSVIPIGFFCAMLGHGLEGRPFSLLSAWGVIALVGIIINDSVVMLDTYNRYIKEGMKAIDAAFEAGRSRFRAVILTSITTVAGLYPLILEQSFQAQFLIPMAISVAHGVLFGTLFILFFFPSLILFYNDLRRLLIFIWTGNMPQREEVEPALRELKKLKQIEAEGILHE